MKNKTQFSARKLQQDFFSKAGHNIGLLKDMFDQIPNAGFYMKDLEGRIVAINPRGLEYNNLSLDQTIGKTNNDLFLSDLTNPVTKGDKWVIRHGRPIISLKALAPDRYRMNVISIFPVRDTTGKIIGTAGCYHLQGAPETNVANTDLAIESAVAIINRDFAENLSVSSLSGSVGLSPATFLRHFARRMKMTPCQYILNVRINKACVLLDTTDRLIADIATATGFCDQSHFIRTFRNIRGITPSKYRHQHKSIGS